MIFSGIPLMNYFNRLLKPGRARTAFSLVEALVCVSVLAIVSALVVVALGRVREMANQSKCATNLRQINTCLQLFAQEYGAYPNYNVSDGSQPTGHWAKRLLEYVPSDRDLPGGGTRSGRSIFTCPALLEMYPDAGETRMSATYGMNNAFIGVARNTTATGPQHVSFPSRTILAGCAAWSESGRHPFHNIQFDILPGVVRDRRSGGHPEVDKHADGAANIVFADGHVEWFSDTTELREFKYRDRGKEDLWSISK